MLKLVVTKDKKAQLLNDKDKLLTSGDFQKCLMQMTKYKHFKFLEEDICDVATDILDIEDLIEKLKTFKEVMGYTKDLFGELKK